jgi:hypothetical protein
MKMNMGSAADTEHFVDVPPWESDVAASHNPEVRQRQSNQRVAGEDVDVQTPPHGLRFSPLAPAVMSAAGDSLMALAHSQCKQGN